MNLLAIETTSNACSVALQTSRGISEEHVVEPRAHTSILMPMIMRLLDSAGLCASDLVAVALGNGPGSFVGMRIGASVAQGICFAAGIGIIPVSSLAAVAAEAFAVSDADRVIVTQDARMNEAYVGVYRRGDDGLPVPESEEYLSSMRALRVGSTGYLAAGGGWQRYPEFTECNSHLLNGVVEIVEPRAAKVLSLATQQGARTISPASLLPSYLRQKVAELPSSRT